MLLGGGKATLPPLVEDSSAEKRSRPYAEPNKRFTVDHFFTLVPNAALADALSRGFPTGSDRPCPCS